MKKYKFIYPFDKETTIEHILKDTHKPIHWGYDEVIYAKVSKNKKRIKLYHGIKYRNSWMPIFELKLVEKSERETVAKGFWRWPLFTSIIYLWIAACIIVNLLGSILRENYKETVALVIAVFAFVWTFGLIGAVFTWIEKKHMKKIIEHLKMAQKE